jgi:hypothetical protein
MRTLIAGVIVIAVVALPTSGYAWPWETEKSQQAEVPPVGRFQIIIHPGTGVQTFLLDTVEGKVWQLSRYTDLEGEPLAWSDMSVLTFSEYDTFLKTHKAKTEVPKQPAPSR